MSFVLPVPSRSDLDKCFWSLGSNIWNQQTLLWIKNLVSWWTLNTPSSWGCSPSQNLPHIYHIVGCIDPSFSRGLHPRWITSVPCLVVISGDFLLNYRHCWAATFSIPIMKNWLATATISLHLAIQLQHDPHNSVMAVRLFSTMTPYSSGLTDPGCFFADIVYNSNIFLPADWHLVGIHSNSYIQTLIVFVLPSGKLT